MKCIQCRTKCLKTDYGFWRCPKCGWSTGAKTKADFLRFDGDKNERERFWKSSHKRKKEDLLRGELIE